MYSPGNDPVTRDLTAPLEEQHLETDYRRLLAIVTGRARRLGSSDAEGSAQEALKRSLENETSRQAVQFYFSEQLPAGIGAPDWSLDRLLAWLHGVLNYVIREEHGKARNGREVSFDRSGAETEFFLDPRDPSPDQLELLIQRETEEIVLNGFPHLDPEYRAVLKMRVDGLTYAEIACRLGVNENTVATWVSRGIRALGEYVRRHGGAYTRFSRQQKQGGRHA